MIFSVADYSVWELFPWEKFVLLYGAAFFFFLLPKPQLVWPLSKFGIFRGAARQPGVAAICCVSVLVVSHFLVTLIPLMSQKHCLESGTFVTTSQIYDGRKSREQSRFPTAPELVLSFEGNDYEVPGSLYGLSLLPVIRDKLTAGQSYLLSINDGVILQIRQPD